MLNYGNVYLFSAANSMQNVLYITTDAKLYVPKPIKVLNVVHVS